MSLPICAPDDESERYVLIRWYVKDLAYVNKGASIAALESSKTVYELIAENAGFIEIAAAIGDLVDAHQPIGWIRSSLPEMRIQEDDSVPVIQKFGLGHASTVSTPKFTRRARELLEKSNLSESDFIGYELVREQDVQSTEEGQLVTNKDNQRENEKRSRRFSDDDIVLIGSGGICRACIDVLQLTGVYKIAGIVDPTATMGEEVLGVPVIGRDEDLARFSKLGLRNVINTVGLMYNHETRTEIFHGIRKLGFNTPNIVHPSAVVEKSSTMGVGNIIFANATVGSAVRIKDNCLINSGAIVSHDCILGDNVHVTPGAMIAGYVSIGNDTLIGMGCTIYYRLNIGNGVTIYNGVRVNRDVPDHVVVSDDHF